ncbi:MAG: hypothetical protein AUJ85_03730 [Elusimicrobia bacterium CG1_02_37_114]|nr:MAG: hypothetical protein AUJ85_03730 [Elusimicrobia bacterium CG1_02_37_114]PIZ13378.1 MAG: hypothetical protein COY53_05080 [Elusimicrobia bacterium CG_4_10_14_0_8_um_filter_37_32]
MIFWLRIIGLIFTGFILQKQRFIPSNIIRATIGFAIYFLIPLFILTTMWNSRFSIVSATNLGLVIFFVIVIGICLALLFAHICKQDFHEVALPIVIMNSGYLGIPVIVSYLGQQALPYAVIYDVLIVLISSTLGVWIIGGKGIKEIFNIPFVYASIIGLILNFSGVPIPESLIKINSILLKFVMPAMLILVGYNLVITNFNMIKISIVAGFLRIFGGFLTAYAVVLIIGLKGTIADVVILASSMPSAVVSYILSEKYSSNTNFAATTVFISTLASILFIPLIVLFIQIGVR